MCVCVCVTYFLPRYEFTNDDVIGKILTGKYLHRGTRQQYAYTFRYNIELYYTYRYTQGV